MLHDHELLKIISDSSWWKPRTKAGREALSYVYAYAAWFKKCS